jgi:uncharacterized protein YaiL (DUF2058 family)
MRLKRLLSSRVFATVAIIVAATATAYRYQERHQHLHEQQDKRRIEKDVKASIESLKLENTIKPLSESTSER